MPHPDAELRNWRDWTDPDFFVTDRHHEKRIVPLFLRQIFPASFMRIKMTLTGWCLIVVSLGLGVAAYNTASNILFLTLSLLLSSLILSGVLSLINFKKLEWELRVPSHLRADEVGVVEIDLINKKTVFPSMSICFYLQSEIVTEERKVYMQNALDPGESCKLKWSMTPRKRGQFDLRLSGVQSKFPFGFLQRKIGSDSHATVIVWPARVEYTFQMFSGGYHASADTVNKRLGQGGDLLNIRPYERGDAPRFIHWKATARTGRLMIRQLSQEGESGYSLYVDTDATLWSEAQFERMCSLVCSLSEDLFNSGRLEKVKLGDSTLFSVQTVHDLHRLFGELSLLKCEGKSPKLPAKQQSNWLTFGPVGEGGVAIYFGGNHAGQIDD